MEQQLYKCALLWYATLCSLALHCSTNLQSDFYVCSRSFFGKRPRERKKEIEREKEIFCEGQFEFMGREGTRRNELHIENWLESERERERVVIGKKGEILPLKS